MYHLIWDEWPPDGLHEEPGCAHVIETCASAREAVESAVAHGPSLARQYRGGGRLDVFHYDGGDGEYLRLTMEELYRHAVAERRSPAVA